MNCYISVPHMYGLNGQNNVGSTNNVSSVKLYCLVVKEWRSLPLTSVSLHDMIVTELVLYVEFCCCRTQIHLPCCCSLPTSHKLSFKKQLHLSHFKASASLGLMMTECLSTQTHHKRLKISQCPMQRPSCGKAFVSRLGVANGRVLDSICVHSLDCLFLWMVSMVLLQSIWVSKDRL